MTIEQEEEISEIFKCLDVLDDRRRIVIVQRFGLDGGGKRTLSKISKFLGVTPSRVRVLECTALWRMRHEYKLRQKMLANGEVKA